ncbi:MAG: site-specific DNA-methyltransferase [Actinomycetota bacterium]
MSESIRQTRTSSFGVGRREGHDASAFYQRFSPPELSDDQTVNRPAELVDELDRGKTFVGSIEQVGILPENSVALVVTSPPYFVGKDYELAVTGPGDDRIPTTYLDYLDVLRTVFAECARVLEPGGRIAVNVANLGRKPYRSLSADVIAILQDDLGLLLRGEILWEKAAVASGSCAWGSFAKASNPVLRDLTERVIVASKGRFNRARSAPQRRKAGLPCESSLTNDEFVDVTRDVWRIESESATRIGHPAPFPIELPRRLIELYTYEGDLVVDPFAGSGTTVVAAARTNRIGVGFDIEPAYVELADQRLGIELASLDLRAPIDPDDLGELDAEARQEWFHQQALEEGRKLDDIAHRVLADAGFVDVEAGPRPIGGVTDLAFRVVARGGRPFGVEVTGPFVAVRPGLQRIEAVWRLLGRLHVVAASGDGDGVDATEPVLVLTSNRPRPGSPADKVLRSIGPGVLFDVIELYDPAGLDRLERYADGSSPQPLPGFWTEAELRRRG